jgi:hypothetical protein
MDSDWVTFYRVWHKGLGVEMLIQKRNGCTRNVPASVGRPIRVVDELLLGERHGVHTDHDLVAL